MDVECDAHSTLEAIDLFFEASLSPSLPLPLCLSVSARLVGKAGRHP